MVRGVVTTAESVQRTMSASKRRVTENGHENHYLLCASRSVKDTRPETGRAGTKPMYPDGGERSGCVATQGACAHQSSGQGCVCGCWLWSFGF